MTEIIRSTPLDDVLEYGKVCKQCGHCCSHGSGFILKEEVKKIAGHLGIGEKEFTEKYLKKKNMFNRDVYKFKTKENGKPYGECVLLKGNRCSIHEFKPLHCRIGNCGEHGEKLSAWFYLNYLVDANDPESIRQWSIYLKSGGKNISGGELDELVPDKEILKKIMDYSILK